MGGAPQIKVIAVLDTLSIEKTKLYKMEIKENNGHRFQHAVGLRGSMGTDWGRTT